MDEVLADFIGAACKVHGVNKQHLQDHRTKGVWSVVEPIGELLKQPTFSHAEFWANIRKHGQGFWTNVEPLPWAFEVLDLAQHYAKDDWYILSSPDKHHLCYSGKVKWLVDVLDVDPHRLIPFPHKHLLAKRGTLLIDDREVNLSKFASAGGDPMLFPTIGNRLHAHAENPMPHLMTSLKTYFGA
jgi:5'(3')-deoxyribonucleotidase